MFSRKKHEGLEAAGLDEDIRGIGLLPGDQCLNTGKNVVEAYLEDYRRLEELIHGVCIVTTLLPRGVGRGLMVQAAIRSWRENA